MPSRSRGWLSIGAVIAVGLVLTFVIEERYHHRILTLVFLWAAMGLAWNIISGYAGQISFGHQAFFGIGAYVTVLLVVKAGLTPWIGMGVAVAVAVLAAVLIGLPTFRLAGIYFGLATLAYPLIFRIVMDWLGYQEVAIPMKRDHPGWFMQFTEPRSFDLLALGVLGATLVLSRAIETSRLGYRLRAIRENEQAAEAMGVDAFRGKMAAYMLSAVPAAVAGAVYIHAILFIVTPEAVFGLLVISQTLVVCLVGGTGTLWGPLIGAGIMVPVSEMLDATVGDRLPGIQGVVYGGALVLFMMHAPEGLYWRLRQALRARRGHETARPPIAVPVASETAAAEPVGSVLLDVRGVSKAFIGLQALSEVGFEVREREILGLIGPNGAGKTTLFNVLNGFLAPDRGEVRFRGQVVTGQRPSALCRRGLGRTFQVVRTFPRLSVLENVMVGAFVRERAVGRARATAAAALAHVGMAARAGLLPSGLTTLELRLMELARCLATSPELVLLDEPLAGLSTDGVDVMIAMIRRVRAGGVTVVIIEHTMQALLRLADRLIVLDQGRRLAEGAPGQITRDPAVIEAYLGKRWLARMGAAPTC
jgi:ABC-type branched-subunit amino acid transport system ATPase component/ABC-type branched-subunit amino acid transport system permease subunit